MWPSLLTRPRKQKRSTWSCPRDRAAAAEQKVSVPQAHENGGKILYFAAPFLLWHELRDEEQASWSLPSSIQNWSHQRQWDSFLAKGQMLNVTRDTGGALSPLAQHPKAGANVQWETWCWGVEIGDAFSATEGKGEEAVLLRAKGLTCLNNLFFQLWNKQKNVDKTCQCLVISMNSVFTWKGRRTILRMEALCLIFFLQGMSMSSFGRYFNKNNSWSLYGIPKLWALL